MQRPKHDLKENQKTEKTFEIGDLVSLLSGQSAYILKAETSDRLGMIYFVQTPNDATWINQVVFELKKRQAIWWSSREN